MSKNTKKSKCFSIDSRVILNLGRESIKDHTTAILELVKNSYDADASKVELDILTNIKNPYIRISDNGCGMTERVVDKSWLCIGYSEKRINKLSDKKRRKTGEKGIGRISADRLGGLLELKTKAKGNNLFGLKIDWDDFDVDNKTLSSIPIEVIGNPKIVLPKLVGTKNNSTGTELIISRLRQQWTPTDIANLYEELSILTPPIEQVRDFEIYINNDIDGNYNGKIKSPFYQQAEIELTAEYDGMGSDIKFRLKDKYGIADNKNSKVRWDQLMIRENDSHKLELFEKLTCGPVKIVLLFYPRDSSLIEGTGFKLSDLREFLDKNAGIKIYRDSIRVKPYGDSDKLHGDWLGLASRKAKEPAGISRPTWVVAPHQVVGGVFITRDNNPKLTDSSGREGLIEDDAFFDLRYLTTGCLKILEAHRHDIHKKLSKNKIVKQKSTADKVTNYKDKIENIKGNIESLKKAVTESNLPDLSDALQEFEDFIETSDESPDKIIGELIDQNRLLGGLATIGIASAIFGHETESSISGLSLSIKAAKSELELEEPNIISAKSELEKSINLSGRVNAWGRFSLTRIQRDKRKRNMCSINSIINKLIKELVPAFNNSNIEISLRLEEVNAYVFQMDIETIVVNLLTNAYSALSKWPHERKIILLLSNNKKEKDGFEIVIDDSGPGVNKKFYDRIWEPLFSLKANKQGKEIGTGLGLSIINSIVTEANGTKSVSKSEELGGASFKFWIPKR